MQTWMRPEDKEALPDEGPWQAEPDKAVWVDKATGLDCMIHRSYTGALCGYVGVPPAHPLYGVSFYDIDIEEFDLHAFISYSARCVEIEGASIEQLICHTPEPGREPDVWWLGFSCGMTGDMNPVVEKMLDEIDPDRGDRWQDILAKASPEVREFGAYVFRGSYKPFWYVQNEVASLASQLADYKP